MLDISPYRLYNAIHRQRYLSYNLNIHIVMDSDISDWHPKMQNVRIVLESILDICLIDVGQKDNYRTISRHN